MVNTNFLTVNFISFQLSCRTSKFYNPCLQLLSNTLYYHVTAHSEEVILSLHRLTELLSMSSVHTISLQTALFKSLASPYPSLRRTTVSVQVLLQEQTTYKLVSFAG